MSGISIDHIVLRIPKSKFQEIVKGYATALEPLGLKEVANMGGVFYAYGDKNGAVVCVRQIDDDASGATTTEGVHFALTCSTKEQVDAFHGAALAAGWKENGKPGFRKEIAPNWYAAFVVDDAGNNVEAVFHAPENVFTKGVRSVKKLHESFLKSKQ